MKKFKSSTYINKKEERKYPNMKRISYLNTIDNSLKEHKHLKQNVIHNNHHIQSNVNASDAMKDFNSFSKKNNMIESKDNCQIGLKFNSNKIVSKERSIIRSKKSEEVFIEALVNKSIDYSGYQNSVVLGKSLMDFTLNQSKRDATNNSLSKDRMNIVYSNILHDNLIEQNEHITSSILFSYGEIKASNIKKANSSKVNNLQPPTTLLKVIKKNSNKKRNDKRKENLQKKANYLNEKSVQMKKAFNQSNISPQNNSRNNQYLTGKTKQNHITEYKYDFSNNDDKEDVEEKTIPLKINQKNDDFINLTQPQNQIIKSNNKEPFMYMYHSQENHKNEENLSHIKKQFNNDDNDECNLDNSSEEDSPLKKMTYELKPISTLQDIIVKTNIKVEETQQLYHSIIRKYLFKEQEQEEESKIFSQDDLNDSHISQLDKDCEDIANIKSQMIQREQYYQNQIKKMQYEMNSKLQLDESIRSSSSSSSSNILIGNNKNNSIKEKNVRLIMEKMNNLEQSLNQKENEYKSTIKLLVNDIRMTYGNDMLDNEMMKEINELLKDDEEQEKNVFNRHNISSKIIKREGEKMNESLMDELKRFKEEENLYHFEIPSKYRLSNKIKCLKEESIKGKQVRFYNNGIIDIIDKKKTTKRVSVAL